MPIVSVIIPVLNRDKIIIDTLEKLKKQNYRPLEIIIVDDASNDNTVKEINSFIERNSDKGFAVSLYLNKINKGACFCRNYGLTKSSGKYIQFLDSDDFLNENKIELQVKFLESNNSSLVISDYEYLKDNKVVKKCKNDGNLFKRISFGWSIYTSSPLIKSSLIKNRLKWNEKILFLQDKDFLFKVLMLSGSYTYIPGYTSYYIQHDNYQISDLYNNKKPQFFTMIFSRLSFLIFYFFQIKYKCIFYTLLGICEIFFQFIFYYLKKVIIFFFGEKIFYIIKKCLNR